MDLIFTNSKKVDQGVLKSYSLDMSYGASENNFYIVLGADEPPLEFDAFIYIEGTEYGGIVDGIQANTHSEAAIYTGRTWHGIINSKVIQPDNGKDYFIVSGDANSVLATLIDRLGLSGLFSAAEIPSGLNITNHQFPRYCKAYDGIRAMLADNKAKLKIEWIGTSIVLSAVPIVDYTDAPIDGDLATLTVEQHKGKVNHMICLGRGELAARTVIHLYADAFGKIGKTQHFKGMDEITEIFDSPSAESAEELEEGGREAFEKLRDIDKAEISIIEDDGIIYDIGDIVSASEVKSGITTSSGVSQKIVKINNGALRTEYQTGG